MAGSRARKDHWTLEEYDHYLRTGQEPRYSPFAADSAVSPAHGDLMQRFESKYIPEPNSGRWTWVGAFHSEELPYGKIRVGNKSLNAHRLSWILYNGEIPEALEVLHKCD